MSLATRRRAIYTGLAGHFAEDELLAVLALWESKYADKPPFALKEFLAKWSRPLNANWSAPSSTANSWAR